MDFPSCDLPAKLASGPVDAFVVRMGTHPYEPFGIKLTPSY
jgi:hypothetical protein